MRGLYSDRQATFLSVTFSPEHAAGLIAGTCAAIETSQYFQLYTAHFDPFDYLAYLSLFIPCYLLDKQFNRP